MDRIAIRIAGRHAARSPRISTAAALALAGGVFAVVLWGCGPRQDAGSCPVIIISIDTCRSDYLGCYGRTPSPSPQIDALAADGIVFAEAVTPVPLTLPAHCSMLTGTTPLRHGVHDNMTYRLAEDRVTLAELLGERGYATGAVLGAFVLDAQFGLSQGFEAYDDRIGGGDSESGGGVLIDSQRRADEVTRRACAWVDEQGPRPFFLFAHYYDPHYPYAPPDPYAGRFAGNPYEGEIAYADAEVGRLLQHLRERDLYDRALIIVAGDHGEGLGDHGETLHGYFVYQSTLHVPLVVKPPRGGGGRRVEQRAGLVDIVPTVLGCLGLPVPADLDGRDLCASGDKRAAADEGVYYCESLVPTTYGCTPLLGLVGADWKLIDASSAELFDLRQDPGEQVDRSGDLAARVEELREVLADRIALRRPGAPGGDRTGPDEETRARLQSLGYLADRSVQDDFHADRSRPHPRDLLAYHQSLEAALERLGRGDAAGARELCARMLAEQPGIPDAWILLGDLDHQRGDPQAAAANYRKYLDLVGAGGAQAGAAGGGLSNRVRAHYNLANELASLGRGAEAEAHYRDALRISPDHLGACRNCALLLAEAGRVAEAVPLFRQALALRPADTDARRDLAQALALTGAADEALRVYDDGLAQASDPTELEPGQVELMLDRGQLLKRMGRAADAAAGYQAVVRACPRDPRGHTQLGRTLLALGRAREGLDAYRRGIEQSPQWHDLARELAWVLATHEDPAARDGAEAIRLCQRLQQAVGARDVAVMELLAAGYAEQGRGADAVRLEQAAVAQARRDGSQQLPLMESRLRTYLDGRPLRNSFARPVGAG